MSKVFERQKTEDRSRSRLIGTDFRLHTSNFKRSLGDYSVGVPPLPIPNREVKPDSADGTAFVGE
jgi:hypothetical protein